MIGNTDDDCPICLNEISENEKINTTCNHSFCKKCIFKHTFYHFNCPLCRSECKLSDITVFPDDENILNEIGIIKITPALLDTGLFILQDMQQEYILDTSLNNRIIKYRKIQELSIAILNLILIILSFYIFISA